MTKNIMINKIMKMMKNIMRHKMKQREHNITTHDAGTKLKKMIK